MTVLIITEAKARAALEDERPLLALIAASVALDLDSPGLREKLARAVFDTMYPAGLVEDRQREWSRKTVRAAMYDYADAVLAVLKKEAGAAE